jgi:hypothetical protein
MNDADPSKQSHREWHGSHHHWAYRTEAFRWLDGQIAGINFFPLAKEIRAWLQQRGHLRLETLADQPPGGYTNPYTFSGASLSLVLAATVNANHAYATTPSPTQDALDAELERLRSYNELILYLARLCEVAIKQLLYCTQMYQPRYERMALGGLLESPCPQCKKQNGKKPHSVSMVGSLAHPFRLCLEFDHCALDHMDLVNKLRNSQAAHSEIQSLNIRTVAQSKEQLLADSTEVMEGFLHMLEHLEKLEDRMFEDLVEKAKTIILLRMRGLPPEDCNFRLNPGERFVYDNPPKTAPDAE